MSSERFESHQEEFRMLFEDLKYRVEAKIPTSGGEERKKLLRDANKSLEEAKSVLQEMEDETKAAPGSYRSQMVAKIRNYHRDLDKLAKDLKRSSGDTSSMRNELFHTNSDFDTKVIAAEKSQRGKLNQGQDTLKRTSESLGRSYQIAAETDEIGAGMIDELDGQKEQLLNARDKLDSMDSSLGKSKKLISTIGRRALTSKVILVIVILVEIIILGLVIYFKFFNNHDTPKKPTVPLMTIQPAPPMTIQPALT